MEYEWLSKCSQVNEKFLRSWNSRVIDRISWMITQKKISRISSKALDSILNAEYGIIISILFIIVSIFPPYHLWFDLFEQHFSQIDDDIDCEIEAYRGGSRIYEMKILRNSDSLRFTVSKQKCYTQM